MKSPIDQIAPNNTVAVYTVLTILIKMKNMLGLEAMVDYMAQYCSTIERNNPKMKIAVNEALSLISIEKLYCSFDKPQA